MLERCAQTLSSVLVFVFEMMMHPEILKKAQEEIDLVIGNDRLPDFDDRPALPYLECVVREVFRYVTYDNLQFETSFIIMFSASFHQFLLVCTLQTRSHGADTWQG